MEHLPSKPIIGITMGDPVGVGAEIIVKALEERSIREMCSPFILGDTGVMKDAVSLLGSKLTLNLLKDIEKLYKENYINLIPLSHLDMNSFSYGKPNGHTGKAMVSYVHEAIHLALRKKIDAIVTCPINKAAMSLAGYSYPGHTELLAEETKTFEYAMMLAGDKLKVVLVTIHHPLREVPDILTSEKIVSTIRLSYNAMRKYFGIKNPKVAVAALNPHAGEKGLFGKEEDEIINPAIQKARMEGVNAQGPFSPDTLFFYASEGKFDVVICMYHDQGLIPLKILHFEDAVNVTLGLPIIRTSVDHGTAYDIAGSGEASPRSLINAIKLATQMVSFQEAGLN